ncbi:MAG: cupin domain-containing protein [Desulfobacteraceae bacterium]|jgi:mannose-6-phosphate isomerase-like protein (cupin superfamily)|nr:cupin domain-containing protein [Desulfobacteraceae bacterium]
MLITNNENTNIGKYDGFSTNLLIGESNSGSKEISIQLTDVEVSGMQFLHSHEQEQCYYIISGIGKMLIDNQMRKVKTGDAVFIPSNSMHGIENIGETVLTYLTANKAFGKQRESEIWPDKKAL